MLYFEQGVIKVWRRIFQGYQNGFLSGAIDCWKLTEVLCWEGIQPAFELSKEEPQSINHASWGQETETRVAACHMCAGLEMETLLLWTSSACD